MITKKMAMLTMTIIASQISATSAASDDGAVAINTALTYTSEARLLALHRVALSAGDNFHAGLAYSEIREISASRTAWSGLQVSRPSRQHLQPMQMLQQADSLFMRPLTVRF